MGFLSSGEDVGAMRDLEMLLVVLGVLSVLFSVVLVVLVMFVVCEEVPCV
jgi:hypothetical protein